MYVALGFLLLLPHGPTAEPKEPHDAANAKRIARLELRIAFATDALKIRAYATHRPLDATSGFILRNRCQECRKAVEKSPEYYPHESLSPNGYCTARLYLVRFASKLGYISGIAADRIGHAPAFVETMHTFWDRDYYRMTLFDLMNLLNLSTEVLSDPALGRHSLDDEVWARTRQVFALRELSGANRAGIWDTNGQCHGIYGSPDDKSLIDYWLLRAEDELAECEAAAWAERGHRIRM